MVDVTTALPMTLNSAQREAMTIVDRHTLVLAGAGSGKTRLITSKLFYLIKTQDVEPHAILAVTFTNRAAAELKQRVEQLLGAKQHSLAAVVSTFHAFGVKFLRLFLHLLPGRQNDFVICDETQRKAFLKEVFKRLELELNDLKEAARFISLCKNKLVFSDAEKLAAQTEHFFSFKLRQKKATFLRIYIAYEKLLQESNRVDFDDLIVLTLRLLREQQTTQVYLSKRWKYLLVDEYQDTDFAQEKIIEHFVAAGAIVTVVGDDNQSIYGFRGAQVTNILSFPKKYANVHCVLLEQNYRSTSAILNLANEVITHNPKQFAKKLYAQNTRMGAKPLYRRFKSDLDEAAWIVRAIVRAHRGGLPLTAVAIFYRTNYQSRVLEEQLVRAQLPYRIVKGFRFYERKEIKEVLAYLQFIANLRDRLAFAACINTPRRALGEQTVQKILVFAENYAGTLLAALAESALHEQLPKRTFKALKTFAELITECWGFVKENAPLVTVIEQVIHKSGLWAHYDAVTDKFERDQRLGSLRQFIRSGEHFTAEHPDTPNMLTSFLEHISLAGTEQPETQTDVVDLLTVHNAKGLEYKHVYVVGMEEGTFPHFLSLGEISQVEEERRLFYVAVTRAMEYLVLSSAEFKQIRGEFDFFKPSRFIQEVPAACFASESSSLEDKM